MQSDRVQLLAEVAEYQRLWNSKLRKDKRAWQDWVDAHPRIGALIDWERSTVVAQLPDGQLLLRMNTSSSGISPGHARPPPTYAYPPDRLITLVLVAPCFHTIYAHSTGHCRSSSPTNPDPRAGLILLITIRAPVAATPVDAARAKVRACDCPMASAPHGPTGRHRPITTVTMTPITTRRNAGPRATASSVRAGGHATGSSTPLPARAPQVPGYFAPAGHTSQTTVLVRRVRRGGFGAVAGFPRSDKFVGHLF